MPEDPKPNDGPDTGAPSGTEEPVGDGAKPEPKEEPDWKAEARKWETRAKQNKADQDELQKLRTERMTESEKALEAARAEGRTAAETEAARKYGARLVQAEFRGLIADRVDDGKRRDALVGGLATANYLKDDGSVDLDALKKWAETVAPAASSTPDLGGGSRRPPTSTPGAAGLAEAQRRFPQQRKPEN